MYQPIRWLRPWLCGPLIVVIAAIQASAQESVSHLGREIAIPTHLQDGDEFTTPIRQLIYYGEKLFNAKFTIQEGAGRPLSKGTGSPLSDPRRVARKGLPDCAS